MIWVMNELGSNIPFGNTETLYGLEGTVLKAITRNEIRAGDLFIWGEREVQPVIMVIQAFFF